MWFSPRRHRGQGGERVCGYLEVEDALGVDLRSRQEGMLGGVVAGNRRVGRRKPRRSATEAGSPPSEPQKPSQPR
jgi:hypothetical protein